MGFFDIGYQDYFGLKLPYISGLYDKSNVDASGYIPIEKKVMITPGIVGGGVVKSIWSGLGTTGKVGVGAIGGATAYGAYDWLFGSKKDAVAPQTQILDQKPIQNTTTNLNYDYDARQYTNTTTNIDSRSWMNISDSPGATMTKKDTVTATATATPSITTPFSFSVIPTQETSADQGQAQGTDFTTIAVIAAIGLIGYGFVSKPSRRK